MTTFRARDTAADSIGSCVITPAGFEGFSEAVGELTPEQQQDIRRVIAKAKEFGMQILPLPQA